MLSTKRPQAQRAFNKESINAVGVVDIACLLESQQSQRTTWKSRVFYKWTLVHNRIECHQNYVFYKGSINSVSVINIACPLRSPQSQRTTENLVSSAEHPQLNVIIMMSSTKGPQTQLVSSTSHVFYELHRAKGQRGISCLLQGVRNRIECHQNDVSCEG